jgi:hypothetical protein
MNGPVPASWKLKPSPWASGEGSFDAEQVADGGGEDPDQEPVQERGDQAPPEARQRLAGWPGRRECGGCGGVARQRRGRGWGAQLASWLTGGGRRGLGWLGGAAQGLCGALAGSVVVITGPGRAGLVLGHGDSSLPSSRQPWRCRGQAGANHTATAAPTANCRTPPTERIGLLTVREAVLPTTPAPVIQSAASSYVWWLRRSPGWQLRTWQRAARVEKRMARARPFLRTERLTTVTPTLSARS